MDITAKKSFSYLISIVLFTLITACGDGSDGAQGATGPQGEPGPTGPAGPPAITEPVTALNVTITSVTINSAPEVAFSISDQSGNPYTQLSGPRFSLVKLIPGTNGNASAWQSYVNTVESASGNGPGTEPKIQATQDRSGTLVNNNDGSYHYTFATDVTAVTTPLSVEYEPNLTHRLGIQISGNDQPVTNAIYTWRPSDNTVDNILTRDIVQTESCNECHGKLAIHGGGRVNTQLCVTCHNPGSTDANSGNTIDFKVMIHKIHRGANLPSVVAGNEYAIWGFRDRKHNFSDVNLPMDIRNCSKCHDESDIATPDASSWTLTPTIEACGSCHDDVNFALGKDGGHPGGVMLDNSECRVCHREGGFVGSVSDSHRIDRQIASNRFMFNILSIVNTLPNEYPQIRFSITDPTNNQAPYNILEDPAFTTSGASRIAIDLAWNSEDYTNEGTNSSVAQAVSLNPLNSAIDNGDGSFTLISTVAIPDDQKGTGAIAIEGHPALDLDGDGTYSDRIPVTGTVDYFSITDSEPSPRRQVVTIEKCQSCHVNLSLHGANRNDNVQLCVMCHNPSNTDISRRPETPADGLKEQSIDMKRMIHSIHASDMRENPFIVYGYGGSEHDFSEVRFPGILENCETCHLAGTYELPLADTVQGSTIDTGADLSSRLDDLKITPTAAVCSSCHDDPLSKAHMKQNGGASFSTTQAAIDNFETVETCVFCHGPDGANDVKSVHKIE